MSVIALVKQQMKEKDQRIAELERQLYIKQTDAKHWKKRAKGLEKVIRCIPRVHTHECFVKYDDDCNCWVSKAEKLLKGEKEKINE